MIKTPLYGHTSEDSAYNVSDYPYSFKLRCRIRYWLESSPNKGYRFVSQTENPKTLRWNAPKKSTYHKVCMCMYLDEKGYVQYAVVNEYTSAEDALKFVHTFIAGADRALQDSIQVWCAAKVAYARKGARGEIVWSINGVSQPVSDDDKARYATEAAMWLEALQCCNAAIQNAPSGPMGDMKEV